MNAIASFVAAMAAGAAAFVYSRKQKEKADSLDTATLAFTITSGVLLAIAIGCALIARYCLPDEKQHECVQEMVACLRDPQQHGRAPENAVFRFSLGPKGAAVLEEARQRRKKAALVLPLVLEIAAGALGFGLSFVGFLGRGNMDGLFDWQKSLLSAGIFVLGAVVWRAASYFEASMLRPAAGVDDYPVLVYSRNSVTAVWFCELIVIRSPGEPAKALTLDEQGAWGGPGAALRVEYPSEDDVATALAKKCWDWTLLEVPVPSDVEPTLRAWLEAAGALEAARDGPQAALK